MWGGADGVPRLAVPKGWPRHHLPQQYGRLVGISLRLQCHTIGRFPQTIHQLWWATEADGGNSGGTIGGGEGDVEAQVKGEAGVQQ